MFRFKDVITTFCGDIREPHHEGCFGGYLKFLDCTFAVPVCQGCQPRKGAPDWAGGPLTSVQVAKTLL